MDLGMKIKLDNEQYEFLKNELGIEKEDVQIMEKGEWQKVREQCFDIEVYELLTYGENCNTERYLIAASIIDA